ncbi:hypothetical protein ABLB90_10555 [Photorhabdus bodei]|uniref:HEPN domain-containing protein n=1 Tax=Photorhabdus kayaii TaxID=230088 RepID=A0ABX0B5T2_9GAMM|nr:MULTISPECIES: hypothetical protein [Photorhabdus]MCC8373236.1 hypothetical protein [Photorhabdus bodei]NDL12674.1 hypothetical protein [Photorhabdus kayaii]NDL25962.1 hypothetical protein [Photorhabdus kayaii]
MDKLRAEFEQWMIDKYVMRAEELIWQNERNCYAIFSVHLAYNAWKAASEKYGNKVAQNEPR